MLNAVFNKEIVILKKVPCFKLYHFTMVLTGKSCIDHHDRVKIRGLILQEIAKVP